VLNRERIEKKKTIPALEEFTTVTGLVLLQTEMSSIGKREKREKQHNGRIIKKGWTRNDKP